MLLAIDVGNTQIHIALFNKSKILMRFKYKTDIDAISNIGRSIYQAIAATTYDVNTVKNCAVSSVVPDINQTLSSAILQHFNVKFFFLDPQQHTSMRLNVSTPDKIGADRIAGCIAAVDFYPNKNLLLFDLGTATVVDVITKNKVYHSGSIFTGMHLSLQALCSGTALLSSVEIQKPCSPIGHDTQTNLQAGLYYAHLGALRECKHQIIKYLNIQNNDIMTVATGGYAKLFENEAVFDVVIDDLVLTGLKIAYEEHQQNMQLSQIIS